MTYTRKFAIAGAMLVGWLGIPGPAWGQPCPNPDPYTGVCAGAVGRDPLSQQPSVAQSEASTETETESESSDTLPVTGGDLVGLTVIGLGAVGVGSVFVRRSRRAT